MILRIIDKETKLFLRDDFDYNPETEIGVDVSPAQGFYIPKYDKEHNTWEEGTTQEYIDSLKPEPHEPSLEERVQALEVMELERILGGGF